MKLTAKFFVLAVAVGVCSPAVAGPIYTVNIGGSGPGGVGSWTPPGQTQSSEPGLTTFGSHHFQDSFNIVDREWFAQVNQGSLHAAGNIDVRGRQPHLWDTEVIAQLQYDDLFFASTSDMADITLHVDLSGILSATRIGPNEAAASATVTGFLDFGPQVVRHRSINTSNPDGFDIMILNETLAMTFPDVRMNTNVVLNLQLRTNAAGGSAAADASNSLHFVTDGPVFTSTDPGFITVDSLQAGIVDNQYSLPNAVPEPSSLALLGMGCVGMIATGWRRRKQIRP